MAVISRPDARRALAYGRTAKPSRNADALASIPCGWNEQQKERISMSGAKSVSCDVLVAGSGAGGLAAATVAGLHGLEVIVAEKDRYVGGTTALSGGFMWVPCNPVSQRDGVQRQPRSGEDLSSARGGQLFQRRMRRCLPGSWSGGSGVLRRKNRSQVRASLGLLRLSSQCARWPARRPLHPGAAFQRPRSCRAR